MNGYNRIIMVGNLTKDPEVKSGNYDILNFRLACTHKSRKKDGSFFEEVCFIDVSVFGQKALEFAPQLHKGTMVLVDGRLKLESWAGQDGKQQSKHKILAENIIVEEPAIDLNNLKEKIEEQFGGF